MLEGIRRFKKILNGDIWVIGSGASMDYVSPRFFDNKITVGINKVYKKFKCNYVVVMHHKLIQNMLKAGQTVIASEYDTCFYAQPRLEHAPHPNLFMFNHPGRGASGVPTFSGWGKDNTLVCGVTTTILAISFAAYMGADNIILAGIDCGLIDGHTNYQGYNAYNYNEKNVASYSRHFVEAVKVYRDFLKKKGINMYSLTPFVGINLEGHGTT